MACRGDVCALFGTWKPKASKCCGVGTGVNSSWFEGVQGNWGGGLHLLCLRRASKLHLRFYL